MLSRPVIHIDSLLLSIMGILCCNQATWIHGFMLAYTDGDQRITLLTLSTSWSTTELAVLIPWSWNHVTSGIQSVLSRYWHIDSAIILKDHPIFYCINQCGNHGVHRSSCHGRTLDWSTAVRYYTQRKKTQLQNIHTYSRLPIWQRSILIVLGLVYNSKTRLANKSIRLRLKCSLFVRKH